jgi:hypothetical protein
MPEQQDTFNNPFDYLIDSFWASLPERTADELGTFKKDVLVTIRDTIAGLINDEIECTDRHLENARNMRERYRQQHAAEAPPNPA